MKGTLMPQNQLRVHPFGHFLWLISNLIAGSGLSKLKKAAFKIFR